MTTARKVAGYIDRQELNRAIRANKAARRLLRQLLEQAEARRGSGWLYPVLAQLAQELAEALEALTEMERIRGERS